MPRSGVTKDQVYAACDAVVARRDEPTLDAVRTEIGSGSKGTIAPLVREWRAEQAATTKLSGTPVPEDVAALGAIQNAKLWAVAVGIAEANLAPQREALAKKEAEALRSVEELQDALDEMEIKAEALEEARKTADDTRIAAEAREQDAVGKLVEAGAAKGRVEAQLAATLKETKAITLEMNRLQHENHRLDSDNQDLRKKLRKEGEA